MSVTCTHAQVVCSECWARAMRAGVEHTHAEVWRQIEEIADSAWRDGGLPPLEENTARDIYERARARRVLHEGNAQRIEQGK